MPLVINQLNARVRVRSRRKADSPLGRDAESPAPTLLYAMPNAQVALQTDPLPAHTAQGDEQARQYNSERNAPARASAKHADPVKVADRVYELMHEELRLSRLRSGR